MGSRSVKFSFIPGKNEQIETVVRLPKEERSVIHGVVKDHHNEVVPNAVVKLFELINPQRKHILKPITHTFTDDCGQFIFGPLSACKEYIVKVWLNNVKIRELIIHPDDPCNKHPRKHSTCNIKASELPESQNSTNSNVKTFEINDIKTQKMQSIYPNYETDNYELDE